MAKVKIIALLSIIAISIYFYYAFRGSPPTSADLVPLGSTHERLADYNLYFIETSTPIPCEQKDGIVKFCSHPYPFYVSKTRFELMKKRFKENPKRCYIRKVMQLAPDLWNVYFHKDQSSSLAWMDPYEEGRLNLFPCQTSISQIQLMRNYPSPEIQFFGGNTIGMNFTPPQGKKVKKMSLKWIQREVLEVRLATELPTPIKILLDPGHGGNDWGAVNGAFVEKDLALLTSKILKKHLEAQGFEVDLTRSEDTTVYLESRMEKIRKGNHDLALSIHFDAIGADRTFKDIRPACYFNHPNYKVLADELCSTLDTTEELAAAIRRHLYLLSYPLVPVILLEVLDLKSYPHMEIYTDKVVLENYLNTWSTNLAKKISAFYDTK